MLCPQRNKGYSVVDKSRTEWVRYYFHLLWAGLVIRDTKGTPKTDKARGNLLEIFSTVLLWIALALKHGLSAIYCGFSVKHSFIVLVPTITYDAKVV